MEGPQAERDELRAIRSLEENVRRRLYAIDSAGIRAVAGSALAAAAAERAHTRSEAMPEWCNDTSKLWRAHLADVWAYLAGDLSRHRALSNAVGGYLLSPLNHVDGQDGPDDFDRPQTIASFSAAASVVLWGVDFATTAIAQVFELIDLKYDGEHPPDRSLDFDREQAWALDTCVVIAEGARSASLTQTLLARLRE